MIDVHLRAGDRVSARRALRSCGQMLDDLGVGPSPAIDELTTACLEADR